MVVTARSAEVEAAPVVVEPVLDDGVFDGGLGTAHAAEASAVARISNVAIAVARVRRRKSRVLRIYHSWFQTHSFGSGNEVTKKRPEQAELPFGAEVPCLAG